MTEQATTTVPTQEDKVTKADRQAKAAKKKRGRGITLMEKIEVLLSDTDEAAIEVFRVLETENDSMRTRADVRQYLTEENIIGKVYPCRIDKCIVRAEQVKIGFSEGE